MRVERVIKRGYYSLIVLISVLLVYTVWDYFKQNEIITTVEKYKERSGGLEAKSDGLELDKLGDTKITNYLYEHYKENIELIQQERKLILREVCTRNPDLKKFRNTRGLFHIMTDVNHEVLFGFCPKVASTTWLRMMIQISGKYNEQTPLNKIHLDSPSLDMYGLEYISKLTPVEGKKRLDSYFKVTFSRNPFERILSAYTDKISPAKGKKYFQQMFGRDIMRRKRLNATQEELRTGYGVTFAEFISWLVDMKHLLALDSHFRPIYLLSKPCVVKYDFIGRFETLHEDMDYVLHKGFKFNSTEHLPFHQMSKDTNNSVIANHYKHIPSSQIAKLKEMYKLDFQLFGYNTNIPGL